MTEVEEYIEQLEEERKTAIYHLRKVILDNLPKGFEEVINYGMIGYVVPHNIYPSGYHCDTKLPLPYLNVASQKNHVAIYHMGLYANEELMEWFTQAYPRHSNRKLDIGKSCVRFKKVEDIPYQLIGELVQKMTVEEWINCYEKKFK